MRRFRYVHAGAAAAALVLVLTGCGRAEEGGTAPLPDVEGAWSVESLTTGGRTLHAPEAARVDIGRDEATGNYGCNGFTARLVHDGVSALTVTPGATTAMACEDIDFETAFAKLFTGRLTIDRGPDRLTLKSADGSTIAMTPRPPAADAPLIVTEWTVDSTVNGDTAASLPAEAAGKARFTIADGTVSGTLGCNRFSAKATVDGSTVTFGPLTSTRMACEGPTGDVERALTDLFGSGPLTWKTKERTLTLLAPDGNGLTATGASAVE
ncbi:META domain-containing protein [Streptomyces sp. NPDC091371]|uniref:META domain-containing protein n=1 Tax=Streptomyces sp. NPDC091371 TaxID=3155303 RepID=UPI00341F8160